ncbi:hypothetical protein ES708_25491 [subsurface metagenome]
MPEAMERALKASARKRFGSATSKRAGAYIYGTMRKTGWKPEREKAGAKYAKARKRKKR